MSAFGSDPSVCIIGAGSTGITVAKALNERGLEFDCFELGDRVGGNWVYENSNGVSACYSSLHINTSRERMEYADYPMPKSYPDFPRHDHIAEYFDSYVDHFRLRDRIRFGTRVERVEPSPGGGFDVSIAGASEPAHYDAVVVANGHHWDPRWPEPPFPGHEEFAGEQIHSHDYEREEQLAGRDVVVLGMGNSAMDIAVDASYYAKSTILAARRGAWVVPKYLGGRPIDRRSPADHLPPAIRYRLLQGVLTRQIGRMSTYGLPEPDHRLGHAHPTVSSRILDRLAHGTITVKPNIAALAHGTVRFVDGSEAHADLVVYCTGYKITFPFLDESVMPAHDNEVRLYRSLLSPDLRGIYFPGLVQPLGAIMPIAERQGTLIAEDLRGRYEPPPRAEMIADIDRHRERMRRRYVASKRHTIQVDFDDYMRELAHEIKSGRERAAVAA